MNCSIKSHWFPSLHVSIHLSNFIYDCDSCTGDHTIGWTWDTPAGIQWSAGSTRTIHSHAYHSHAHHAHAHHAVLRKHFHFWVGNPERLIRSSVKAFFAQTHFHQTFNAPDAKSAAAAFRIIEWAMNIAQPQASSHSITSQRKPTAYHARHSAFPR